MATLQFQIKAHFIYNGLLFSIKKIMEELDTKSTRYIASKLV